jgi:UDP-N-acetylmuramate-alanine ligase
VQPGDLVITMGGGDVYKCARMIIALLKEKE